MVLFPTILGDDAILKQRPPTHIQMHQPSCGQKERLLGAYMEAVRAHSDTVGLLKAVRDQPKAFSSVLKKAKEAYAECGRVRAELEQHCKAHGC
jgi:hypothetical protein